MVSLANSFGEFDVSPFKEIELALACLRGVSKIEMTCHYWNFGKSNMNIKRYVITY